MMVNSTPETQMEIFLMQFALEKIWPPIGVLAWHQMSHVQSSLTNQVCNTRGVPSMLKSGKHMDMQHIKSTATLYLDNDTFWST